MWVHISWQRTQINCYSALQIKVFALREGKLKLLSKPQVLEASENQAEGMEQAGTSVHTIWLLQKQQHKSKGQTGFSRFQPGSGVCWQCGFSWPHVSSPCAVIGKCAIIVESQIILLKCFSQSLIQLYDDHNKILLYPIHGLIVW